MDLGPIYHGYVANICRTVAVRSVSEEKKRLHYAYLKMQKAVKPRVKVLELENLASEIIKSEGYSEYYVREIGYGISLTFEENPC